MKPKVLQWPMNGLTSNLISSHFPCVHSSHTSLLAVLQTILCNICGSVHLESPSQNISHPTCCVTLSSLILPYFSSEHSYRVFIMLLVTHIFSILTLFRKFQDISRQKPAGLIGSPQNPCSPRPQRVTLVGNLFFATVIS